MKPAYWDAALRTLAPRDRVLAGLFAEHAGIHMARRGDPFTTLARAIVGQQISVKAAQAVWERLCRAAAGADATGTLAVRLDALRLARMRIAATRRCGLSERKAEYIRDLARHFVSGRLDPRAFPDLDDETLIAALCGVKGIGRWTAEMFLMFHELRADILPVDDIGLQNAIARHYNDGERMPLAAIRELGEAWRPYRSVATWYLWRSLDPIPVEY